MNGDRAAGLWNVGDGAEKDVDGWRETSEPRRAVLVEKVFGGFPAVPPIAPRSKASAEGSERLVHFQSEPGLELTARVEAGKEPDAALAILIDLDGAEKANSSALAAEIRRDGWGLVTLDPRATGKLAWPSDKIGRSPDHNTAEGASASVAPCSGSGSTISGGGSTPSGGTMGAPLTDVVLIGDGAGGLVALCAASIAPRVARIAALGTLVSYLAHGPYIGQWLGIMAPSIVHDVGDVVHLAARVVPRRVVIAGESRATASRSPPIDSVSPTEPLRAFGC